MRYKTLLLTTAGVGCLVFCSMGDQAQEQTAAAVPPCHCSTGGTPGFNLDNSCNPGVLPICSLLNLVTDTLACGTSGAPNPCPVTGSVTVTYDSCTTVACVEEFHTGCNTSCPGATGESTVANGASPTPKQGACCLGPTGQCIYTFEIRWYVGPTSCPNTRSTAHCRYDHQFKCDS